MQGLAAIFRPNSGGYAKWAKLKTYVWPEFLVQQMVADGVLNGLCIGLQFHFVEQAGAVNAHRFCAE